MDNTTTVGMNRTGLDMAPMSKDTLVQYAQEQATRASDEPTGINDLRKTYALESDRVGTVPVPARLKGMASTVMDKLKGTNPEVLIDKLGERLAYERTGVRLYEALITKVSAAATGPIVDVAALQQIRADEESHFHLLARCLSQLGADPTAMTPCADIAGVAALGHLQVITDPRTTVSQALNSILMIELGDNASWELLIELARAAGHDQLAESFTGALQTEQQHLVTVKNWLREAVLEEAT
ncbi:MAG TPA: ferritin-like domain-containing protein [Ramlibacter sp.]|jgi:ferritin-like metal-binding protein YciE|uniref:ferritin-like domain-containing protein n=1 Tax=Ramlibacter sp. TaxID=1917967 RepID=UPI002D7014F3|nr:ferritin-like domain-containing protein [Ramlibacter sp.]HZY20589.1 ferritin-like domain-containing protein [Ramlibacter sp.]